MIVGLMPCVHNLISTLSPATELKATEELAYKAARVQQSVYESVRGVVGRRRSDWDSLLSRAMVAERPAMPEARFYDVCYNVPGGVIQNRKAYL